MLTGSEKIKDIDENDICNYIGNSLSYLGANEVSILKDPFLKEKIIQVKFSDGFTIRTKIEGTNARAPIERLEYVLRITRLRNMWRDINEN
jgi:hypothetical protein